MHFAKRPIATGIAAFVALWGAGLQAGGSPAAPANKDAAESIIRYALAPSPLDEDLRQLTDEIGGRVTGSAVMARAVAWGVNGFKAAGVSVHTEGYELPASWEERTSQLQLMGPVEFPVNIVSVAWAPATATGGIEAPLVDVGNGAAEDFARAASSIRGSMILVNSNVTVTWSDLTDEYRRAPAIIHRAVDAGARAILWVGARDHRVLYRHADALEGEIAALPMAVVAREDALRLIRTVAAHPGKERGRLSMPNRVGGPIRQENVIGEIQGRERSDEVVILAAHLDSWELGTGALDNGCNAALVIAAARAIEKAHLQPRSTLRFILFTGEEQGMVGSHAYVLQHRAELDRIRAVIVYDAGTGRVTGYSLGGRDDIQQGVTEVLAPLAAWRVGQHTLDAGGGTDNFDFLLEGVPTLVANQEESNYMANYHAATDTLDKVDFGNLQLHVAIAALTAYGIADRPERLGPRQSRQEIEALLKRTGLDQELKALGYWPAWESGARGRQP